MRSVDLALTCTLLNDQLAVCGRPAVITSPSRCATHKHEGIIMSDRVLIPVSVELARKLARAADRDQLAADAIVDKALEGDPKTWRLPPAPSPAAPAPASSAPVGLGGAIRCSCCVPFCQNTFEWRGVKRCACELGTRPGAGRPGIVQPDLDRE